MSNPTKQVVDRMHKLSHSLEVTIEEITNLIYNENLIEWAENIGEDPNASEQDLDFADGVLEIVDKLSL